MVSLKDCLSSDDFIDSTEVPNSFIPILSRNPDSASSIARFKPVCPPRVANILSGFSLLIIFLAKSISKGSIYTLYAMFLSVIIVAGLLFTSTTSIFSSLSARQACVPA
jgi:hypothetical protein